MQRVGARVTDERGKNAFVCKEAAFGNTQGLMEGQQLHQGGNDDSGSRRKYRTEQKGERKPSHREPSPLVVVHRSKETLNDY